MFKPAGTPARQLHQIALYRDELEALVLCDGQGLTQEEAGDQMGVSRGTVQRLLASGRRKVADALSAPHSLVVEGGQGAAPRTTPP